MYHSPSTQPMPEEQSPGADEAENDDKFGYLIYNNCWHEIPIGETKIGRDASLCSIVLNDETVSKVHAVVESEGAEDSFIYDAGSVNKTRIGKMKLRPHCRYKINDDDVITLGSSSVKFKVIGCKMKNCITMSTPQAHRQGECSVQSYNRNINLPIKDIMLNANNNIKNAQEVFKSPSMSLLKLNVKQVKRHYYMPVGENYPASDIFSQATQCEVTNIKCGGDSFKSDISPVKYDDIYNLSTQCEYAGDFLQSKDKTLERPTAEDTPLPKLETSRVDCDFNESGTYEFVKGNKITNFIKSHMNDSYSEDIFELSTQCPTQLNSAISKQHGELNFTNKINQPTNFGESIKMKLPTVAHEKGGPNKAEMGKNLICLSNGEDEELCKVMRVNSPVISTGNNNPIVLKSNFLKSDNMVYSNDIFDVATQVPSEMTEKGSTSLNIPINKDNDIHGSPDRIKNSVVMLNNRYKVESDEDNVVITKVEFQKPGEVSSRKVVSYFDEDMILTQAFNGSHHNSQMKFVGRSNTTEEKVLGENDAVRKAPEGSDNSEDLASTQLFVHGNHTAGKEKQNNRATAYCSQDDIATQVFAIKATEENERRNGGNINEENQLLSVIIEEAPPKLVPDFVSLCDSGDETESDLEMKLCLESSIKKEGRKSSDFVKREPEASAPPRQSESDKRPSTASSDRTVSDLDVAELEEASASLIEKNNCEDFIATQLYPTTSRNPSVSRDKTHLVVEGSLKKENIEGEDFISTQIFPKANGKKSPSEISNKTESDIAVDARPGSMFEITEVSSEGTNGDIDENSNESESLIKEIDDFGSSSPVMVTAKRRSSTLSPELQDVHNETVTLTPSHPLFEAFSEVDGLIGKMNDKSDSGIGAENMFEGEGTENKKKGNMPDLRAAPDSDETDCEEELEVMKTKLGRQETFVVSKQQTETGTPLLKDIHPSTSNTSSRRKAEGSCKRVGRPSRCRTGITKSAKPKKSENSIKSYFSSKVDEATESPLKRTLLMNTEEGIPKKRVKSVETREKREIENIQTGDVILTQSLKLRNRVIRPRKATPDCTVVRKRTGSEMKTPGDRRMTELHLGNTIETVPRVRAAKEKPSAIRKLVEEFQVLQEDNGKKILRRRKANGDAWKGIDANGVKVVFTGFESDCHDRIIQKLGGERVNHLNEGHILVTDRVRRTVKFLSAVALGLPIVSPKWLTASDKELKFLNPWNFFLEDKPSEERWGFNLKATVEKWRKQKLLKGYAVYATENTRPPVHEILSIVSCCGGSPLTSHPDVWPEKSIVLTCPDDKKSWPPCKFRQVKIVHYEIILSGVLKHFMDFKTYKLR